MYSLLLCDLSFPFACPGFGNNTPKIAHTFPNYYILVLDCCIYMPVVNAQVAIHETAKTVVIVHIEQHYCPIGSNQRINLLLILDHMLLAIVLPDSIARPFLVEIAHPQRSIFSHGLEIS